MSRTRLRFDIALSMNYELYALTILAFSYFLYASIPNLGWTFLFASLVVFYTFGLCHNWKTVIIPTADLMCDGEVALCRIDRVTWQDPILCGGSYPRRADYTLFVRDGNGDRTIPGQLRKPEQIRALSLREGDIRHAIYDPADPTRNTLDVHLVRWAEYERLVEVLPVIQTVESRHAAE